MAKKWKKGTDGKFRPEEIPDHPAESSSASAKPAPAKELEMFDKAGDPTPELMNHNFTCAVTAPKVDPAAVTVAPKVDPASVTVAPKNELASPEEFGFNFRENFHGGATPRLPQIGIVSTAQMFKCGEDKFKDFTATILHYQLCNAWWEKTIEEGAGNVPDCASSNAIAPDSGDNRQCESCDKCLMNAYGSDPKDGRGKWCKNMIRLHILKEGDVIPSRLTLPATSIRPADEFFTSLFNKKIPYQIAKVTFSLVSAKNKTNVEYSKIQFEVLDTLKTRDEMLMVKRYIDQFKISFGEKILADEHAPAEKNGDGLKY